MCHQSVRRLHYNCASLQKAYGNLTLDSGAQVNLDFQIQLNADSQTALLVLGLLILIQVGCILKDLDLESGLLAGPMNDPSDSPS